APESGRCDWTTGRSSRTALKNFLIPPLCGRGRASDTRVVSDTLRLAGKSGILRKRGHEPRSQGTQDVSRRLPSGIPSGIRTGACAGMTLVELMIGMAAMSGILIVASAVNYQATMQHQNVASTAAFQNLKTLTESVLLQDTQCSSSISGVTFDP